jgi:hypothetical protein
MVASRKLTNSELIFTSEGAAQMKTTGEKFQALLLSC